MSSGSLGMKQSRGGLALKEGGGGGSSASGVSSISINGGAALTGAISLLSPMALAAGNTVRVDNGNVKTLTDAASITGMDVDINQSFRVTVNGARSFAIPTASLLGTPKEGEKVTVTIQKTNAGDTVSWTGGAGGFAFANAASGFAVTQSQFDSAFAAAGAGQVVKIAWEWDTTLNRWLAVGLGAYYL